MVTMLSYILVSYYVMHISKLSRLQYKLRVCMCCPPIQLKQAHLHVLSSSSLVAISIRTESTLLISSTYFCHPSIPLEFNPCILGCIYVFFCLVASDVSVQLQSTDVRSET
jgi:hypothetical protein